MNTDTTFVLADNQDITREGMKTYLHELFKKSVVLEVADRKTLIQTLTDCSDSVVIIDYTLFDIRGIEDLTVLLERFRYCRWIMFSNELSENFIRRFGCEQNVSMILKENTSYEIRSALTCAVRGDRFFCHQATDLLLTRHSEKDNAGGLTATEIDVLKQITKGKSVKEIAAARCSSIHTIITHKKNIFRKLGVNTTYEATKYALRAGLVEMAEYYI